MDLVLEDAGEMKQAVIKLIFDQSTLGLPEVRAIVATPPGTILSEVSRGKAEFLEKELEDLGAKARIKE